VGVNNRDLRTFTVNLSHSISLQSYLPAGALKVAESGLRTAADIGRLRQAGFDAFLIGESLLTTQDPSTKLRELLGR
jgi:indole-3-glycerol phosphate synthase